MQLDSVRSTFFTFARSGVTAQIVVNLATKGAGDKRLSAVTPYTKKNSQFSDAHTSTTVYANIRTFLCLEVVNEQTENGNTTTDRQSVWVSYPHMKAFSKGLEEVQELILNSVCEDDDGTLFVPLESKNASVVIEKMVGDKTIVFKPAIRKDDLQNSHVGVLMYIGEAPPAFINEDDIEAFSYIVSKLDLYTAGVNTYLMGMQRISEANQVKSNFKRRTPAGS